MSLFTRSGSLGAVIVAIATGSALGEIFGFYSITNDNPADEQIGEAQLFVQVDPTELDEVAFTFFNSGPNFVAVTAVYFDNGPVPTTLGSFIGLSDFDDGTGGHPDVDFSLGANPPDLPGGKSIDPPFTVTPGYLMDSDAGKGGTVAHGIAPHEYLIVTFDLVDGLDFEDLLTALADGELRIGIKGQGFEGGGSESFINNAEPTCEGDANGDDSVDEFDLPFIIEHFDCTVGTGDLDCDSSDTNHNGIVDPLDKGYAESRFGLCP